MSQYSTPSHDVLITSMVAMHVDDPQTHDECRDRRIDAHPLVERDDSDALGARGLTNYVGEVAGCGDEDGGLEPL